MKNNTLLAQVGITIAVVLVLFLITKEAVYMSMVDCPCGPCNTGIMMNIGLLKLTAPYSELVYAKYCNMSIFYLIYSFYWLIIGTVISVLSVNIYKKVKKKLT